jgi:hypothetical protein
MAMRKTAKRKAPRREKPKPGNESLGLWERLAKIGDQIPDEELDKHPHDGSINLEHYLYGRPKQSP